MSLGLASNEEIAVSLFKNLIENDDNCLTNQQVLECEINVETFLSLFKPNDLYCRKILKALNNAVR